MKRYVWSFILLIFGIGRIYAQEYAGQAFTYHPDGNPVMCLLNLNSEYERIGIALYPDPNESNAGWIVTLIDETEDYIEVSVGSLGNFYIKKGALAVNTRNYNGTYFNLYAYPNKNAEILSTIKTEQTVRIYGLRSTWLYVQGIDDSGAIVYGWLEPSMQCSNPFTTCP